ncbi:MAG TPA: DUF1499 domain-containing protein [Thermoanaerobaculia bacterium]|nr:DUF1499 domain-containing protein [Thermoanaerobaculia bacterium]
MSIGRLPPVLALLAVVLLALAAAGVRLNLWSYRTGFQLLGWGALVGIAATAGAIVALAVPKVRSGAAVGLMLTVGFGLALGFAMWRSLHQARAVPQIHDISTDLSDPPAFVAILPLRAEAPNPAGHGGADVAAAQRRGYPDLQPLELAVPPATAFARAVAAARAMAWDLVAADPAAGRIEATATTFWFGFKDDVVVRVMPAAAGSRVDVRSVSRVGRSDLGANANRIRAFLAKVASP